MKEEGKKKKKCFLGLQTQERISHGLREALGIAGGVGPLRESLALCQEGRRAASAGALPAPSPRLTQRIQLLRSLAFDDRNVGLGQVSYKDVT